MFERIKKVEGLVDALLEFPDFVEALIADGWTEEMATKGFAHHERTWRGIDKVRDQMNTIEGKEVVKKVCHVWPALPGAGVSPVLFGLLCGVEVQHIKASRRGQHFANYFISCAHKYGISSSEDLFSSGYERIIVSGADETIAYFKSRHENVIGFGHRESVAVVDSNFRDFQALAGDIAQWDQQGCFSVRAVFYIGDEGESFSQKLADALYEREGDSSHDSDALSTRLQKRALQEMTAEIFVAPKGRDKNCAWVVPIPPPKTWRGGTPAPGCVNVYIIDPKDPDVVFSRIGLPSYQRQGVALSVSKTGLADALLASGFTLISRVGRMQSPEFDWLHDGRSNVEMFLKN